MKLDATSTQSIKINKAFRKVCPLSPTLYNMYINYIIRKWKEEVEKE